ncbi:MAG: hypothetical protein JWM47_4119 [Acidimicrobiales bacterium]|nr:hypothetical protein [Acidimicrobiales bacterium]
MCPLVTRCLLVGWCLGIQLSSSHNALSHSLHPSTPLIALLLCSPSTPVKSDFQIRLRRWDINPKQSLFYFGIGSSLGKQCLSEKLVCLKSGGFVEGREEASGRLHQFNLSIYMTLQLNFNNIPSSSASATVFSGPASTSPSSSATSFRLASSATYIAFSSGLTSSDVASSNLASSGLSPPLLVLPPPPVLLPPVSRPSVLPPPVLPPPVLRPPVLPPSVSHPPVSHPPI